MENRDSENNVMEKWNPTARRYVCFIDIMGFKDMVATKKHSDIYAMMEKIVGYQRLNSSVKWQGKADLVKTTTYSDSIIVYSLDDSINSLNSIICTVSGLTQDLLSEGIPYKGAISIGDMTCDLEKSIYFGQPLIDSYILQEELYFYGIVLHGSVEKEIEKNNYTSFITEYNCPFKKGKSNHMTIVPMYMWKEDEKSIPRNDALLKSVKKMKYTTSGNLRIYIDSTIKYLESIRV